MAGLIDSLTMAARSVQAQQYAMDVTGQNIANVNTPGYTRRVVDFAAVPPRSGGGVEIAGVRAVRDALLDNRALQQVPLGSRDAAIAEALAVVETAVGAPGASLDARLDAFFNAFAELAENPTSPVARGQVQLAGAELAGTFNDLATRLDSARLDADARIRGSADEINTLTARAAEINAALPSARMADGGLSLMDEQAQVVRRLTELTGAHTIPREDGGVDLTLGNGRPLVVGHTSFPVTRGTNSSGHTTLTVGGVDLTAEIAAGTLGGLLHVRDGIIPGYLTALDALASGAAAEVNALHAAGRDLNGSAGGPFFSFSVAPGVGGAGSARAIRLDSGVAQDVRRIAAATTTDAGDNGTARRLAALRDERVLNGDTATLHDGWGALVYQVGADARQAARSRDTHAEIIREVDALRDQVSGVSLDEEALNLLKFQRAYEANARFFTAVDRMLVTLLNTFGAS